MFFSLVLSFHIARHTNYINSPTNIPLFSTSNTRALLSGFDTQLHVVAKKPAVVRRLLYYHAAVLERTGQWCEFSGDWRKVHQDADGFREGGHAFNASIC